MEQIFELLEHLEHLPVVQFFFLYGRKKLVSYAFYIESSSLSSHPGMWH